MLNATRYSALVIMMALTGCAVDSGNTENASGASATDEESEALIAKDWSVAGPEAWKVEGERRNFNFTANGGTKTYSGRLSLEQSELVRNVQLLRGTLRQANGSEASVRGTLLGDRVVLSVALAGGQRLVVAGRQSEEGNLAGDVLNPATSARRSWKANALYTKFGNIGLYNNVQGSDSYFNAGGIFFKLPEQEFSQARKTDACYVDREVDRTPPPGGFTTTYLDAGAALKFSRAGQVVATAPKLVNGSATTYSSGPLPPALLPLLGASDVRVDVPGGPLTSGFPAFSGARLPSANAYALTSPVAPGKPGSVTADTVFTWSGAASQGTEWSISITAPDEANPGKVVQVTCAGPDDGEFAFPAATKAELARSGFRAGAVTVSGRSAFRATFRGDALLNATAQQIEIYEPSAEARPAAESAESVVSPASTQLAPAQMLLRAREAILRPSSSPPADPG